MTERDQFVRKRVRRRRHRLKSTKKVRFFLMSVGLTGLFLGMGLLVLGFAPEYAMMKKLGFAYIAFALAVFFLRGAIDRYDVLRRERYARHS